MADRDWHQLRFLESAASLRPLLHGISGRVPSSGLARDVSACLQQGRLYYESAATSALEIRPLLLYYGFLAFARALVMGRTGRRLSTLARGHGLADKPKDRGRVADATVAIGESGTFPEFNDVARHFSRLCFFGHPEESGAYLVPATRSSDLRGRVWSLPSLLSRLPELQELYQATFGEKSNVLSARVIVSENRPEYCRLLLEDTVKSGDREQLRDNVEGWRARFPFLRQWRIESAYAGGNRTLVRFENITGRGIDTFDESEFEYDSGEYDAVRNRADRSDESYFDVASNLSPLVGAFPDGDSRAYFIDALDGQFPSEFSLHFLILFALSSLVRYRPDAWTHSISRSAFSDRPADDQVIAVIERFLDRHAEVAPGFIVAGLNPSTDEYATSL